MSQKTSEAPVTGNFAREWAKHPHAMALFDPDPGDRIRLLVSYGGFWRALVWLNVAKDGSIYLGARIENVTEVKRGGTETKDGIVTIRYDEGEPVDDVEALKHNPKLSFHASGLIREGSKSSKGTSLRDLKEQFVLCQILFEHPSKREPIDTIGNRDICMDYPVDEQRPLLGGLLVAPLGKHSPANFAGAFHCSSVGLTYTGLQDIQDLFVQFALWHGPEGNWPPMTYMTYVSLIENS